MTNIFKGIKVYKSDCARCWAILTRCISGMLETACFPTGESCTEG